MCKYIGVKTRIGVIGLDGNGVNCETSKTSKLETILKWAHFAGKSTGIVTTTRVTHATPAGRCNFQNIQQKMFDNVIYILKRLLC